MWTLRAGRGRQPRCTPPGYGVVCYIIGKSGEKVACRPGGPALPSVTARWGLADVVFRGLGGLAADHEDLIAAAPDGLALEARVVAALAPGLAVISAKQHDAAD